MTTYLDHHHHPKSHKGYNPLKEGETSEGDEQLWNQCYRFLMHSGTNQMGEKDEERYHDEITNVIRHELTLKTCLIRLWHLAVGSYCTAIVLIFAYTFEPKGWTVPSTSSDIWIDAISRTLILAMGLSVVNWICSCGTESMLSCIEAPFITLAFAPSGKRLSLTFQAVYSQLAYTVVVWTGYLAAGYTMAAMNQNNAANIAYPAVSMNTGYYNQWWSFGLIVFFTAITQILDIYVTYRTVQYDPVTKVQSYTKMGYWRRPETPSLTARAWFVVILVVRSFIFFLLTGSPLEIGTLLTAPIISAQNRTDLGLFVGAILTGGVGIALLYVYMDEFIGFRKYGEYRNDPSRSESSLAATSSMGTTKRTTPVKTRR